MFLFFFHLRLFVFIIIKYEQITFTAFVARSDINALRKKHLIRDTCIKCSTFNARLCPTGLKIDLSMEIALNILLPIHNIEPRNALKKIAIFFYVQI